MASLGEQSLTQKGIQYSCHEYDYRKKGAEVAAAALGLDVSAMLKTLVVKLADGRFVLLVVPGDKDVSMRSLARALGVKSAELAAERDAQRLTGYRVGGISPFGTRTPMDVWLDLSAVDYDRIYVNGGRRGLILGMALDDFITAAKAELIDVGINP